MGTTSSIPDQATGLSSPASRPAPPSGHQPAQATPHALPNASSSFRSTLYSDHMMHEAYAHVCTPAHVHTVLVTSPRRELKFPLWTQGGFLWPLQPPLHTLSAPIPLICLEPPPFSDKAPWRALAPELPGSHITMARSRMQWWPSTTECRKTGPAHRGP